MPRGGFWIVGEDGDEEFLSYDEIDEEALPQLWKPLGGFCYLVEEFLKIDMKQTPFYIHGWLPKRGRLIIYAPAKAGKSFFAAQLARSISSGEPLLGMDTSRGRVLLIQFELGEELLQSRLLSTGKSYDDIYVGTSFHIKLDTKDGQEVIWRAMEAVRPNVVI
ncbi:MAG: AAA family ATPase, partial [Candidatus Thorarchaeota archaeon]